VEKKPYRVHVCCGPNCTQFRPKELLTALEEELRALGIEDDVSIQLSACRNRCEQSPSMNVYPGPVFYNRLTPEAMREIDRQHLTGGEPVDTWLFKSGMAPTVPRPIKDASRPAPKRDAPDDEPGKKRWRWW
jgi:(2Fe-2S) ferredoxin